MSVNIMQAGTLNVGGKEEALLWVTFSSSSYEDLLLNWVAHVKELQVVFGILWTSLDE